MSAQHILLIEDDPLISRSLSMSLALQGYQVNVAETCAHAREQLRAQRCDVILLDINLPDGDGFSLCREIRQSWPRLPVLMLTANVAEQAAVQGMECGADDYIRKPFGLLELLARIRRMLERQQGRVWRYAGLCIDADQHRASVGDTPLTLGKREFAILSALVARAGEVLRRQEILDFAGLDAEVYDRTIDSHLSHLRKKLKDAGASASIVPVYGVGYRLEPA